MKGKLIVISGPSGSGKSTITHILEKERDIKISVSATTRKPRKGETDGINYYFLTKEQFEESIEAGQFYEYADVFGNYYGTLKSKVNEMREAGYNVILEIDVQGAMQIKEQVEDAVLIFIMPPDMDTLKARLTGRKTETDNQVSLRLSKAEWEIGFREKYDYTVINDYLDRAVEEIKEIIMG